MRSIVYVDSMLGLGDNIFQRPFVHDLAHDHTVLIKTPWPQLYSDVPHINFVNCQTSLRTQNKNLERVEKQMMYVLRSVAEGQSEIRLSFRYGSDSLARESILKTLRRAWPLRGPMRFDLPPVKSTLTLPPKPYIVVRPATLRTEWFNQSRNPSPAVLYRAVELFQDNYDIVSVADVNGDDEDFEYPIPPYTYAYHKGELAIQDLIHLVSNSVGCVGGVGWIVPMAIAAKKPLLCILGGMGKHNAPEKITDPEMNLSKVIWAKPEMFCMCDQFQHACDKRIRQLGVYVHEFHQLLAKE